MIENGDGSIIALGATNSEQGVPYHAHSGAGKAGVHNLMQSVAAEWGRYGIRANTVAPGLIDTEGVKEVREEGDHGGTEFIVRTLAADRPGTPADCVTMNTFLASDAAAKVTGSYFAVDRGHLLPVEFPPGGE
jgi:NAD(P)-dependent dehydrogenase (short-subunit alcohol dehydrogenase family)